MREVTEMFHVKRADEPHYHSTEYNFSWRYFMIYQFRNWGGWAD